MNIRKGTRARQGAHTYTLTDDEHEAVVRAVLVGLHDQLSTQRTASWSPCSKARASRRLLRFPVATVDVLGLIGWPGERPEGR